MSTPAQSDRGGASPAEREAFAATNGWASLEQYVERKISEARRAVKITTALAFEGSDAPAHWRGHLAALVRLRRKMKRTREATPNDQDQAQGGPKTL